MGSSALVGLAAAAAISFESSLGDEVVVAAEALPISPVKADSDRSDLSDLNKRAPSSVIEPRNGRNTTSSTAAEAIEDGSEPSAADRKGSVARDDHGNVSNSSTSSVENDRARKPLKSSPPVRRRAAQRTQPRQVPILGTELGAPVLVVAETAHAPRKEPQDPLLATLNEKDGIGARSAKEYASETKKGPPEGGAKVPEPVAKMIEYGGVPIYRPDGPSGKVGVAVRPMFPVGVTIGGKFH